MYFRRKRRTCHITEDSLSKYCFLKKLNKNSSYLYSNDNLKQLIDMNKRLIMAK
jgi:hypothetical protein